MQEEMANVMTNIGPGVKQQAEEVLASLGIPVSMLINSLYRQIIEKKDIPFSLDDPSPIKPDEEISEEELDERLAIGLYQAEHGQTLPFKQVIAELRGKTNDF